MKKLFNLLIAGIIIISFVGCESKEDKFVRLTVELYKAELEGEDTEKLEEELEKIKEKLTIAEFENAKKKVAKKIGEELFSDFVYEMITSSSSSSSEAIPITEEYTGKREILDWYTSLGVIETKTCDDIPATVKFDVVLGYKKDDKVTSNEITRRTTEIKDFLRRYINSKTANELKNPANEEKLKVEIRNSINDKYLTEGRIRDVVFLQKDVIEQ